MSRKENKTNIKEKETLNSMCNKCKYLNVDCKGTTCKTWTGCIYREVK